MTNRIQMIQSSSINSVIVEQVRRLAAERQRVLRQPQDRRA
jgi:cephalosporin hydroxylase